MSVLGVGSGRHKAGARQMDKASATMLCIADLLISLLPYLGSLGRDVAALVQQSGACGAAFFP